MTDKERLGGSEYPFPPWEKEVKESLIKKDLGFSQVVGLISIAFLRAVIAAEWLSERVQKIFKKNPQTPHNQVS